MRVSRCMGWWVAAALGAALAGCGEAAAPAAPSRSGVAATRAVYDACFAVFLPPECTAGDPALRQAAEALHAQGWTAAAANRGFREALDGLETLAEQRGKRFAALPAAEREAWLLELQRSPDPRRRLLAQGLRVRFLAMIYSPPVGLRIAGLPPQPVVAADAAARVTALRQSLPASALRYDAARGEVAHSGGAIDVLIVGSGPAGAVLGHELRRGGKRVVLLDRGPLLVPGAADGRAMASLMESGGGRTSADGGVWFRNGQTVGGGTAVNIDLAFAPTLPLVRARIEAWRQAGRIGPEQFSQTQIAAAYAWVTGMIGTRQAGMEEVNANNRILWEGATREGMTPALYGLNTYAGGAGAGGVTDKRSAVEGLILTAMKDRANPLSLLPEARVMRLLWAPAAGPDRRAAGVEVEMQRPWDQPGMAGDLNGMHIPAGTRVRIAARQVILCAGTLGSAALLLNSGLDNGQIGRGIVAHPSMPLIGVFDREIRAWEGTPSTVYVADPAPAQGYVLEATSAMPAYVAGVTPGDGEHVFSLVHQFAHLGGFGVMLIDTPSPEHRIRVGGDGEPVIEYRLSEADKGRFGAAVAEGVRVMFRAGAKQVILPTAEDVLGVGRRSLRQGAVLTRIEQAALVEKNLRFIPGETVVTSAHLQGSAKMGSNPANSVVSPELRVWGCANVWVMDSSVFPTSIGANPMQSVYTLAKVFADRWEQAGR